MRAGIRKDKKSSDPDLLGSDLALVLGGKKLKTLDITAQLRCHVD